MQQGYSEAERVTKLSDDVKKVLQMVSWIAAIHLTIQVAALERVPLPAPFDMIGGVLLALFSGYAFLQAELMSVKSIALPLHPAQRVSGILAYVTMMGFTGVIQTGYYGGGSTAWLHNAMGWWIVAVAIGMAAQWGFALSGEQTEARRVTERNEKREQERAKREAEERALQREEARRDKERAHELRLKQLDVEALQVAPPIVTRNATSNVRASPNGSNTSQKERVVPLLEQGFSNEQIVEMLPDVAPATIRKYRSEFKAAQSVVAGV